MFADLMRKKDHAVDSHYCSKHWALEEILIFTYWRDNIADDVVLETLFSQRFGEPDLGQFGSYDDQ